MIRAPASFLGGFLGSALVSVGFVLRLTPFIVVSGLPAALLDAGKCQEE